MLGNPAEKKNLAWSPTQIPYRAQGCMSFKGELTQQQQNMSPPLLKSIPYPSMQPEQAVKRGVYWNLEVPSFTKKVNHK